jgi:flagellar biosynthesis GTPase FlhF
MRSFKSFLVVVSFLLYLQVAGQAPAYDDIVFDEDEMKTPYKPVGKSFELLKSKKGTGGMPKVASADAIKTAEVTDIILVFSETTEDAASTREESNRERWENLLLTYPEFFQFSTNYKNICQCNIGGDAEALKPTQGFYVYYKVAAPKVETPVAAVKEEKSEPKEVAKTEKNEAKETKKSEEPVKEKKEDKKEVAKEVKKEEKSTQKEPEEKEEDLNATTEGPKQTSSIDLSSSTPKKAGSNKPRKAKSPKACRPPFYGSGDEDLNIFFKDNITLTKKQRRQVKGDVSILKLSLNFDGSIKKAMVNGANTALNDMVSLSVKSMNPWNAAVKGGFTVKSEVKITLKYDKSTKAIRPLEVAITPRPNPKCIECKSDSEIFGSE